MDAVFLIRGKHSDELSAHAFIEEWHTRRYRENLDRPLIWCNIVPLVVTALLSFTWALSPILLLPMHHLTREKTWFRDRRYIIGVLLLEARQPPLLRPLPHCVLAVVTCLPECSLLGNSRLLHDFDLFVVVGTVLKRNDVLALHTSGRD